MNLKKLFATTLTVLMVATMFPVNLMTNASYSDELEGAYDYAYGVGATTMDTIETSNVYGQLIRSHMAKMLSAWAKEVLGLTPDTSKDCEFTDIENQTQEMKDYIVESCQLGLMGVGISEFRPNDKVTRAEFGTVLSRALRGDQYDGGTPYYADHLAALKDAGVMNDISNPSAFEVRGYVRLMMQRADEDGVATPATCKDPMVQIACAINPEDDACPVECRDVVIEENSNGNLDVSMDSSNGGDIPYNVSSLPVATYEFTADEDVTLNSVTFEQGGYSDDNTLDGAALFIDGARVSKVSDFNSDDEVTLNITSSYKIKGGTSVKIAVHARVASGVGGDQFNIKLLSANSTAEDVDYDANLTSETFNVLNKANAEVGVSALTAPENPNLGEEGAELFEFKLTNNNDQDVTFQSITFKGSGDTDEEYFENFKLQIGGETIAETDVMNGKYLSFDIEDGSIIKDSDTETFTVVADVIGGASKTIGFYIEKAMDVVAIGDKYDVPAYIDNDPVIVMPSVVVQAGDVTISKTNPTENDIIRNRDNLFLGSFTVTNNAGGDITLQDFKLTFTGSVMTGILDNVKVRLGSATASNQELDNNSNNTVWTITDLGKSVGSKLVVFIYADTVDLAMDTKTLRMTLSNVVIEEDSDDEVVSISPSTLTFTNMEGSDSDLTLTNVYLANKTFSEGTENVDAISFKIKAGSTEGVKIKKLTFTATGVDSDTVTAASFYKGTTKLEDADVNNGTVVVNDDIELDADETATFTLKLDLSDNAEVTGFLYALLGANIEAEDTSSDQNDLVVSNNIAGRTITILSAGTPTLTYEANVTDTKYDKNILAGQTASVATYSLYSNYETLNVGSAIVEFSTDMQDSLGDVQLWYNGEIVASDPTWSAGGTLATFDNIDFDTLTTEAALLVKVVTNTIDEDGGEVVTSAEVVDITLGDIRGNDSGEDVNDKVESTVSKSFDVVPVTIFSSISEVTATTAKLNLLVDRGENTSGTVIAKATAVLATLSVAGNNGGLTKVRIENDANDILGTRNVTGDAITISGAFDDQLLSAGTTTWTVYVTQSAGDNPSYTLSLNGISYTTNVNGSSLTDKAIGKKTIISK